MIPGQMGEKLDGRLIEEPERADKREGSEDSTSLSTVIPPGQLPKKESLDSEILEANETDVFKLLVTSSRAAFYFSFTLVAALVKGEQHLLTSQMENGVLQLNRALLTTGTAYYKPRYTTDLRR
ncbi:unnamed protein product [Clavelina lepadiformis]|uniref:Uncharacterized protein n=1 Tax=Clavelina lepadiformis TaxID=159417 RepID=A0ABP0H496_CLALP